MYGREMKVCTKCKLEKLFSAFCKSSKVKDGLSSQCKDCDKQYRLKNRDRLQIYHKNYYQKHKEDRLSANKTKKAVESQKEYYQRNRDYILLRQKQYYQDNRDNILEKTRKYKQGNKEKYAEYNRTRRALIKGAKVGDIPSDVKFILFQQAYGLCSLCGDEVDWDDVHIDHILPIDRGGHHALYNLQITHGSCNDIKFNHFEFELLDKIQAQVLFPAFK